MVGTRILTDDEDEICFLKTGEANRAFADPNGARKAHTTGFVAHVGAIRQVVGADLTGQCAPEECCFVARAAARVQDGLIRTGERLHLRCDHSECVLP